MENQRKFLSPYTISQKNLLNQEQALFKNSQNSLEMVSNNDEDFNSSFAQGLASSLLLNTLTSISFRLKRKTLDQWKRRTCFELNHPLCYKIIPSPSRLRENKIIEKMLRSYTRFFSRKVTRSFNLWKVQLKKSKNDQKLAGISMIFEYGRKIMNFGFMKIWNQAVETEKRNSRIKLSIKWALARLNVSKGLKTRKAFKKWYIKVATNKNSSRLNLHMKVMKFKNYQAKLLGRISGIYKKFSIQKILRVLYNWKIWTENEAKRQKAEESLMIKQIMSDKRLQNFKDLENNLGEQRDEIILAQIQRQLYEMCGEVVDGTIQLI